MLILPRTTQLLHRRVLRHPHVQLSPSRRPFSWNPIQLMGERILDLGSSLGELPLPEAVGPCALSIVITTIAVRTAVTLPSYIWARRRIARHRDYVIPEIVAWRKPFAKQLAARAKTQPNPKEWFEAEFKTAAIAERKKLLKQHHCQPLYTSLLPPLILIPTIIITSLAIRSICVIPSTPLALELNLFSAAPLAIPDPTGVWPLLVGGMALVNVELGRKMAKMRAGEVKESDWARREALRKEQEEDAVGLGLGPRRAKATTISGGGGTLVQTPKGWKVQPSVSKPSPVVQQQEEQRDTVMDKLKVDTPVADPGVSRFQKVLEQVGRGGSVLMIGVSMIVPGALTLCWVTSSCFSITQTLISRWFDQRFPPKRPTQRISSKA
ncbi:hypothetical protein FRB95_010066 [Tulasnella sp. JGI-2019a]|nr:hypothetical protein FRB95_010066 [Tulasnella sp. JGI-2019a]